MEEWIAPEGIPGKLIYYLSDPETGLVMWVGATRNLHLRLSGHLRGSQVPGREDKSEWIDRLKAKGLRPEVTVLGFFDDWESEERFYISYFSTVLGFPLLNRESGGHAGKYVHPETRKLLGLCSKGRPMLPHVREALFRNRPASVPQDIRDRISRKLKGRRLPQTSIDKIVAKTKGQSRTEEQKLRMSIGKLAVQAAKRLNGFVSSRTEAQLEAHRLDTRRRRALKKAEQLQTHN